MRYAIATLAFSSVVYAAAMAMLPQIEFTVPARPVPAAANSAASAVVGRAAQSTLAPRVEFVPNRDLTLVPGKPAIKRYPFRYWDSLALRDVLHEWTGESSAVSAGTAASNFASLPQGQGDHQTTASSVRLSSLHSIHADTGSNELIAAAKMNNGFELLDRLVAELDVPTRNDDAFGNEAIDMEGFLRVAHEAANHRESRRVSEADFIRMSKEPGTIILDARSRDMFDLLHVEGAINLPFSDISIASLEKTIPDKSTRILIYCNNNFRNNERAFASKSFSASLNLSTYATLYNYGYRNIYELGPRNDVNATTLRLAPSKPEPYWDTEVAFRLLLRDS